MSRRKVDRYSYVDSMVNPSKPSSINPINMWRSTPNNSLKSVEKIYIYLNDGRAGMNDFLDLVKSRFCTPCDSSNQKWSVDKEGFMEYLMTESKFKGKLDALGYDDYDRLYYGATHTNVSICMGA